MGRLDIERQQKLEPKRIETAIKLLQDLGIEIEEQNETVIKFYHKSFIVTFFPYSGWHTGKSIQDGRGLINLLKQLK